MMRWGVLYKLYEWRLRQQLMIIPSNLCFMIYEEDMLDAPDHLAKVANWCIEISHEITRHRKTNGINSITFHISAEEPTHIQKYLKNIYSIAKFAHLNLHYGDIHEEMGEGISITVAIAKSGKEEIIEAIRRMVDDNVSPEKVDEHTIEKYLTFHHSPDFVIKTGGSHLVDFLIWQSVYSELVFLELDWSSIRRVDLLRAFRDYQSRTRRFGT